MVTSEVGKRDRSLGQRPWIVLPRCDCLSGELSAVASIRFASPMLNNL
jgi:hypothetical protein